MIQAPFASPPATATLPPLDLAEATARGFCAGVDRAIRIVEVAIGASNPVRLVKCPSAGPRCRSGG